MINKYMLKEVLFYKEKYKDQAEITQLALNKHYIEYTSNVAGNPYNYITHDKINVYELAHLCKEWAISKGFITHSVRNLKEYVVYLSGDFREPSDDFRCNSEPEAIFKACQWILDNVKTNSLS